MGLEMGPVMGLVMGLAIVLAGCSPTDREEATTAPASSGRHANAAMPVTPDAVATPIERLNNRLVQLGDGFPGELGIAVRPVDAEWLVGINAKDPLPQQSVSKLWVALTVLSQVDAGTLDLSTTVTIKPEDLTIFYQPIRDLVLRQGSFETSYADLLERALASSDNTANDVLLRASGGPKAVRATLARHDLAGIRFGPGERVMQTATAGLEWDPRFATDKKAFFEAREAMDQATRKRAYEDYLADPADAASAADITRALALLARGQLLSAQSTRRLMDILATTKSGPNRLKGGVPKGWRIAHKTGTGQALEHEQTGYNDVGILTAPSGRQYAVAVLIKRTEAKNPRRFALMHSVVAAVVAYEETLVT